MPQIAFRVQEDSFVSNRLTAYVKSKTIRCSRARVYIVVAIILLSNGFIDLYKFLITLVALGFAQRILRVVLRSDLNKQLIKFFIK